MKSVTPSAAPKRAVPARPHAYGLMSSSGEEGKMLSPSKNPLLAGVVKGFALSFAFGRVSFFPLLSGSAAGGADFTVRCTGSRLPCCPWLSPLLRICSSLSETDAFCPAILFNLRSISVTSASSNQKPKELRMKSASASVMRPSLKADCIVFAKEAAFAEV